LKEQVTDELLPRAFSVVRSTWVWIDPVNGWLLVDAGSPSAEEVLKLLFKAIPSSRWKRCAPSCRRQRP
jgi:recombination associated protein RdgC